jgi:YidC/Oxa1 family membrane protein insertase
VLASLSSLITLVPAIGDIPVWTQYRDFIEWALNSLADALNSGGLAIIAFTIGVKTLLMPLTVQSLRSSKAMQELQPRIKELQKKHGKDRQRLTQETMRLYSQHHVNPMSGCLPMVLQIPIFLGLYRAIRNLSVTNEGPWNGAFLWLRDGLHEKDPYFVLPILAGLFQLMQTRMMRPANQDKITDPQQAMMNTMMSFMPLTVVVFGWNFASGAVLYWATQSIYSVIQQWFITGWGSLGNWFPWLPELPEHRRLGYRPPRPVEDPVVVSGDGGPPVRTGRMGWLQARMEQAMSQQQGRAAASEEDAKASEAAGDAQARADAESRAIAGTTRPRRGNKSRSGSQRAKAGGGNGTVSTRSGTAGSRAGAPLNGADTGHAEGNGRAVVIPRKARPARGGDQGSG